MPELPSGTLTLLFTDIEDSTGLTLHLGTRYPEVLAIQRDLLRAAFREHDGHEVDTQGDSFFAVFPRATQAVLAAVQAQRALAALRSPEGEALRVRMGLHTGEPLRAAEGYTGVDVVRGARIAAAGHGGQVLLSQATADLVQRELLTNVTLRDLGLHRFKGLPQAEHIFQLVIAGLPAAFPLLKSFNNHSHNLPAQFTPLVGREQQIEALLALFRREDVRLLTLTGPGGVGKTRLAVELAARSLAGFPDGVIFVNLAPISDPALVVTAIVQSLALRETGNRPLLEHLKEYLQEKQLLLLLDNFEQVLDAVPSLAELLARCPKLKLLVTSRAALHLRGEQEFPVLPLALPNRLHLPSLEVLSHYAAVELFIQRAVAVKPDFAVTNQTAPAVAEICARLDGLPLAIELAAARSKLLSPQALLARLDNRLTLLTSGTHDLPARQRTLRGAIAWSYDLLHSEEQALFRRLSVIAGSCELEAVEAVCGTDERLQIDLLDGLQSLVDKSLIRQQETDAGTPRFWMLQTIREYGLEQLAAREELETVRQRQMIYYLAVAEEAASKWREPDRDLWLQRIEREYDNLRTVLGWASEHGDAETKLRLVVALARFWNTRGQWSEGRHWLAIALGENGETTSSLRAKALRWAASLAVNQADFGTAQRLYEQSLTMQRVLNDQPEVSETLHWLGHLALARNHASEAQALFAESLQRRRDEGDDWSVAELLNDLGNIAYFQKSDYAAARTHYEESLLLYRALRDQRGIAGELQALANVARHQGAFALAQAYYEESLRLLREIGDDRLTALVLINLAAMSARRDDYATARSQQEEALSIGRRIGDPQRVANMLGALVRTLQSLGDLVAARTLAEERLAIFRSLGAPSRVVSALTTLAGIANDEEDYLRARAFAMESHALSEDLSYPAGIAAALLILGIVSLGEGGYDQAETYYREALTIQRDLGPRAGIAETLDGLAAVAAGRQQLERTARLLGAAEALRIRSDLPLALHERETRRRLFAIVQDRLDEPALAAVREEGQAMSLEQAISYALSDANPLTWA
ncbi:MAG: ATP-binding protein [Dehalococcoidia bacterium]